MNRKMGFTHSVNESADTFPYHILSLIETPGNRFESPVFYFIS